MKNEIILGLMRIHALEVPAVERLIKTAVDNGITFFDNADIYGGGCSESLFGEVLKGNTALRESITVQSKCGIRNGYYDFSAEHITQSVDGILKRLNTDYLDALLLHRPDALAEYDEVAEVFTRLKKSGKVREFGVSNMNPYQIALLEKEGVSVKYNQMQLSIVHSHMLSQGLFVNMSADESVDRAAGVLEYCRLKDVRIQAWSCIMASWQDGTFIDNDKYAELNLELAALAEKYGVTKSAVAVAWILRIPQYIMPIIGTTNEKRVKELALALKVNLTRPEWYSLYQKVGHKIP